MEKIQQKRKKDDMAYTYIIYKYQYINIYTYNKILLSFQKKKKKKSNPTFCNNMNECSRHYVKRKKPDRGKHCMVSLVYETPNREIHRNRAEQWSPLPGTGR